MCLAGALALLAAAFLPLIRLQYLPGLSSVSYSGVGLSPQLSGRIGGWEELAVIVLPLAATTAFLALVLMVSRGWFGYLLRLGLLCVGLASGALGLTLAGDPGIVLGNISTGSGFVDSVTAALRAQFVRPSVGSGTYAAILAGALLTLGALLPTKTTVAETSAWPPAASGDQPTGQGRGTRSGRRLLATATVLVLVAAAVVLGGLVPGIDGSGGGSTLSFGGPQEADAEAQQCRDEAMRQQQALRAEADRAFKMDDEAAIINRDGNHAYVTFADQLRSMPLAECDADFRAAWAELVVAWEGLGTYLSDAAKPHAPWNDDWSDEAVAKRSDELWTDVEAATERLGAPSA